jgi:hypothetical protein
MAEDFQEDGRLCVTVDSPDKKWAAIVEDDGDTGYFYLHLHGKGIQESIFLYKSNIIVLDKDDVEVYWTMDSTKCGVAIWKAYRAIIDLKRNQKLFKVLDSVLAEGIQAKVWILGLPMVSG